MTARYSAGLKGKKRTVSEEHRLLVFVPQPGVAYVSELPFTAESNGCGPVERDLSNGERDSGDGNLLQIAGTRFYKGLGTHASSSVSVRLDGGYKRFTTQVGVDDEVTGKGTVAFEVIADGKVMATTPLMTVGDRPATIGIDVTAVQDLTLRATDGGDGISFDHADWANTRLVPTD
ncbi:NPCBM/NEW2 domain-containing protein [Streptomyces sp. NBC_00876]|uniref:NPCBM/NEW2 domain-containing protein n=1 Tax=Streptomyces sp. NBC_00876 TaxID=2975853 RepID=UPI003862EC32|nr:NPCBM/NEW2 domain-containing protein [Streptomyces sp. NBC_00876]